MRPRFAGLHSRGLPPDAARGIALVSLALLLAGCAVNPATGRKEFSLVSADQELAIGSQGYPATLAEYGLYDDPKLAAYVDSVGQRVAHASELPNLTWHFTVLDDPVVNAFAMPGGYIYITRGILSHLNSEAQLAGVLGHEIGHVTARHSAKQITQQQIATLGLTLASAFSTTLQRYSGPAQQALGLMMLKYSRDDETQADALGIRYSTAAGYDPREIPDTYAMLKRISAKAGSTLPIYMSTHPDPGDREARTAALSAQAVVGHTGLAIRGHTYLDHVRGVVYGDDPRGGWVTGTHFVQPRLGFELDLPAGWTVQNTHAALTAAEPQQKGALQYSLASDAAALSAADYVAALRRDGRITSADGGSESIGGWPAWIGRIGAPADGSTTRVLVAAWVRLGPDRLLQCLGQGTATGDAYESAILASVRSLRAVPEMRRTVVEPDRVRVKPAPASGTLPTLLARLGGSPVPPDELAILNGIALEDPVPSGAWLKIVEAGRR